MGLFLLLLYFQNPKFSRVGFSSKQGGIFMVELYWTLLGMLIIGGLLGSLITQYLIKRHTSGGTFIIEQVDEKDFSMFVSFDEKDPGELAKSNIKYIILERRGE